MELITEKFLIAVLPPIILLLIKWINYAFNVTGERDKTSREKIELLKSTLEIENSLHIAEYKILYEETFSLIYKKTLHFDEIKRLLHTKSPKKAINHYLKARPVIDINPSGEGFRYILWNRIRFGNRLYWFPTHGIILLILYFLFAVIGVALLIAEINLCSSLPSIFDKNSLAFYIINILLTIIAIMFIYVAIKCLNRIFGLPLRSELVEALENLADRELVIFKPHKN